MTATTPRNSSSKTIITSLLILSIIFTIVATVVTGITVTTSEHQRLAWAAIPAACLTFIHHFHALFFYVIRNNSYDPNPTKGHGLTGEIFSGICAVLTVVWAVAAGCYINMLWWVVRNNSLEVIGLARDDIPLVIGTAVVTAEVLIVASIGLLSSSQRRKIARSSAGSAHVQSAS